MILICRLDEILIHNAFKIRRGDLVLCVNLLGNRDDSGNCQVEQFPSRAFCEKLFTSFASGDFETVCDERKFICHGITEGKRVKFKVTRYDDGFRLCTDKEIDDSTHKPFIVVQAK